MSWRCIFHGHEIMRYDRELAWQCIGCLRKWPMAPELVRASGVYAQKSGPLQEPIGKARKADQEPIGIFQRPPARGVAISPQLYPVGRELAGSRKPSKSSSTSDLTTTTSKDPERVRFCSTYQKHSSKASCHPGPTSDHE
ncbi:MAG: hypothetical protein DMG05_03600 [Acidobacteria bacterium]|nr:MAG: hypothetical protein DMG05_03600 [Acidobacteriota bacterium]